MSTEAELIDVISGAATAPITLRQRRRRLVMTTSRQLKFAAEARCHGNYRLSSNRRTDELTRRGSWPAAHSAQISIAVDCVVCTDVSGRSAMTESSYCPVNETSDTQRGREGCAFS